MKGAAAFGAIAALIVLVVVALASLFTVDQTEQALVLRFGEPVAGRGLITTPGLHYKYPFIENVVFLDNRILVVEAPKHYAEVVVRRQEADMSRSVMVNVGGYWHVEEQSERNPNVGRAL